MTPLVQGCIVVVTIAVVVVAYFAARLMSRIEVTTQKLNVGIAHLEVVLEDARQTSGKVKNVVGRIESVVDRVASLGATVLDDIVPPVRNVLGVIRGIRAGVQVLTDRFTNGREPIRASEGESNG